MTAPEPIGQSLGDSDWNSLTEALRRFITSKNTTLKWDELEDVVQETLVRAWAGRDRFRSESDETTFLFAIALNVLREERPGRCPVSSRCLPSAATKIDLSDPERRLLSNEIHSAIKDSMEALTDAEREAAVAVWIECLPRKEAAANNQCTEVALRSRLFQARKKLRRILSSFEIEER